MQPMQRGQLCRKRALWGFRLMLLWHSSFPCDSTAVPACHSPPNMKAHPSRMIPEDDGSSSLSSLNCIINRSGTSRETNKHDGSLNSFVRRCAVLHSRHKHKTGAIIIQSNIYMHTFDSHKRLRAHGYVINMTGFMNVSGQRDEWWEDDRQGSSAPGTPECTQHTDPNTHQWIQNATRPVGGGLTGACSGRLLFIWSSCLF